MKHTLAFWRSPGNVAKPGNPQNHEGTLEFWSTSKRSKDGRDEKPKQPTPGGKAHHGGMIEKQNQKMT